MAPETFSRAQADLEADGHIRVDRRRIDIPDVEALEAVI